LKGNMLQLLNPLTALPRVVAQFHASEKMPPNATLFIPFQGFFGHMFCRHHYRTPSVDRKRPHPETKVCKCCAVASTTRHCLLVPSVVFGDLSSVIMTIEN
jgi:hypothetical protein